jgi:hypothetical protein
MAQNKSGIATTVLAPDPDGEGFIEISPNKTLFIQKLSYDDPLKPQIVEGLQTVDDVFNHFKPSCKVELDREDGSTINENFNFGSLSDFDLKNLINQSTFLTNTNLEHDAYLRIVKQLGTNKSLKNVIENAETKKAFINSLKALVSELEED